MSVKQQENPTIVSVFSLLDWVEAFMLDRRSRGLSQGTIDFYRKKLKHLIEFCNQKMILDVINLTASEIRTFFLFLKEKGHNQGGIYAHFKVLRSFLYWYQEENELYEWSNPIRKVKVKSSNDSPLEPADINAIKAILKTCGNNYTGKRDKAIILMLLDTGIRASELISINHENINPITGVIQILNGKGGKFRVAYLSKKARLALRKYIEIKGICQGALFTSNESIQLTYSGLRMLLRRRSIKAGVIYQSPHSFRRLFALTMLRNGTDLFSLQLLMGHADLQVLRRYLKQVSSDLQDAHIKGSPVRNLGI
jgi:integrase/recombinase XerD